MKSSPLATRCQVEGLGKIIKQLSRRRKGEGTSELGVEGLLAAHKKEHIRTIEVKTIEDHLHESSQKYDTTLRRMRFEASDAMEEALNVKYNASFKET